MNWIFARCAAIWLPPATIRWSAIAPGLPFMAIVSPSVLFDELEVKRADNTKEKLPDYPAPSLTSARN